MTRIVFHDGKGAAVGVVRLGYTVGVVARSGTAARAIEVFADFDPAIAYEMGKELLRASLAAGFQPPRPAPLEPLPVIKERGQDK